MKNTWPILAAMAAGAAYLFRDQLKSFFAPAAAAATPAGSSSADPSATAATTPPASGGGNTDPTGLFVDDTGGSSGGLPPVTPKLDQIQSSPYLGTGTPAPATGTAGNHPNQPAQTVVTAHKRQEARQAQRDAAADKREQAAAAAAQKRAQAQAAKNNKVKKVK